MRRQAVVSGVGEQRAELKIVRYTRAQEWRDPKAIGNWYVWQKGHVIGAKCVRDDRDAAKGAKLYGLQSIKCEVLPISVPAILPRDMDG